MANADRKSAARGGHSDLRQTSRGSLQHRNGIAPFVGCKEPLPILADRQGALGADRHDSTARAACGHGGVISGYQVGPNGELSLLGNGVTAQTQPGPLDDAFIGGDLYDVTSGGSIIGYQVQADGLLTSLDLSVTIPAGSRGLVAIAVPEPSTWAMMLLGFVGLAPLGARKVHAATAAG